MSIEYEILKMCKNNYEGTPNYPDYNLIRQKAK